MSAAPPVDSSRREAWMRDDWVLAGALVAATLIVRIATLRTIDLGGDATFKWYFVRTLQYANPWIYDHHTARWSVNLPIYIVQRIFGPHPNGMYVAPLAAAVLQAALLYACGRALDSRALGVFACLLTWQLDSSVEASSQLLPGVFQATYLLGALHALLRFTERQRRGWLVLAAAWTFAAYLSMITTVYALPGIALAVLLVRRNLLDVALVLGAFALLVGLETLAYAIWTPYPYGQLQVIARTHTNVEPTTLLELVTRSRLLPLDMQLGLAAWLACGLAWPWLRRSPWLLVQAKRAWALWLVPGSVFAGLTVGIKQLQPIVPAVVFRVRYYDVLVPPLALCLAAVAIWSASGLAQRLPSPPLRLPLALTALVLAALSAIALYAPRELSSNALVVTHDQYRTLNAAAARGIPIVAVNRSDHMQMKTLTSLQRAYLDDRFLIEDGQLKLRRTGKTTRGKRTYRYWSASDLTSDRVQAAMKQRACFVGVTRRAGEPKLGVEAHDDPACALASHP